jgi:peptidoglycan/xylan/chitin deacetylase (PgdA/CDA1 family)
MPKASLRSRIESRLSRLMPVSHVKSRLAAPVASISFDDIPVSAARSGAPVLEEAGVLGTYYVCGGHTAGTFEDRDQHTQDDIRRLHAAGHEIACHTFGHPLTTAIGDGERQRDADANAAWMSGLLEGTLPGSFAYPYGWISPSAKLFYARRFLTCRGVQPGVNAGWIDFGELKAVGIERRHHDMGEVRSLIESAKASNGWLVFYTHDVTDDPTEYGCRQQDLVDVVQALQDAGIEILPVKAAAARAMFG